MKLLLVLIGWCVVSVPVGIIIGRFIHYTSPSKPECYCKGDPADVIHEDYDEYGI